MRHDFQGYHKVYDTRLNPVDLFEGVCNYPQHPHHEFQVLFVGEWREPLANTVCPIEQQCWLLTPRPSIVLIVLCDYVGAVRHNDHERLLVRGGDTGWTWFRTKCLDHIGCTDSPEKERPINP